MRQILDSAIEEKIAPIWRQAFRPFFLFGSLFSALAIIGWVYSLFQQVVITPPLGLHFWHSHEMIFGFVAAIIAGFLLTAVQNWTGLRALNGKPLLLLFVIWLIGRFINGIDLNLPVFLIAGLQGLFWLCVIYHLIKPVWLVQQYRNLIFLPVLSLFCLLDVGSYYVATYHPLLIKIMPQTAVFLVVLLMTIISGRVFPMFTANGTKTDRAKISRKLEVICILFTILLVALPILTVPFSLTANLLAMVYLFASVLHALRALQWKPWVTFNVPLVWSLHLSYWFIPVGLVLLGLNHLALPIPFSAGLHAITVGAMSLMILAMIARVSLGHSGRSLTPPAIIKYAFLLLALSATSRVAAEFDDYQLLLTTSAMLFALAFILFFINYFKILTTPRADGRPG